MDSEFTVPGLATAIELSPCGTFAAAASITSEGGVRAIVVTALNREVDKSRLIFPVFPGGLCFLSVSSTGMLVIPALDSPLRADLVDIATGERARAFIAHAQHILCTTFSRDGSAVAAAGEDACVSLTDVASGRRLHTLALNDGPCHALAFSHDGALLATGEGGDVAVWDVASGERLRKFSSDVGIPTHLAFSHKGFVIAAAGDEGAGALSILSVARGASCCVCPALHIKVGCIAFTEKGALMAVGLADVLPPFPIRWDTGNSDLDFDV